MRHRFSTRILGLVLSTCVLGSTFGCAGSESAEFDKVKKGGSQSKTESTSATDRLEHIDLLFEQVSHAHHAIGILLNRPEKPTTGPACAAYFARPGKKKFLVADYGNCQSTVKTTAGEFVITVTGSENFLESTDDENLQAIADLKVRIQRVGESVSKATHYKLVRRLELDTSGPASLIVFRQTNQLDTENPEDRSKLDTWISEITGSVRSQQTAGTWSAEGFNAGAVFNLRYSSARVNPNTRKLFVVSGQLRLTSAAAINLSDECGVPLGQFEWTLDESTKRIGAGSFVTDATGMIDPTEKDPDLQKLRPWGECKVGTIAL